MNLYCTPKKYIGAIGSFAFSGAMIACLFLPRLADKFGRFSVYMATIILQLPLYIMTNMAKTLMLQYIVSFFLGVATIGRFTSGFVLLTESVSKKH